MNLAVLFLVFRIAREAAFSLFAARFAVALFAISIISAFYTTRLLSETLFTILFVVSIWALLRGIRCNSLVWFGTSGVALGIATLVRPATQFYGLLIVLAVFLFLAANGRRKTLAVAVFAAANILVLAPLVGYNLDKYGSPQISTNQGRVAWNYMAADLWARSEGITFAEAREDLAAQLPQIDNPYELSSEQLKLTITYIADNPIAFVSMAAEEVIRTFAGTGQNIVVREILRLEEPPRNELEGSLFGRIKEVATESLGRLLIALVLIIKLLGGYALMAVGLILLMRRRQRLLPILIVASAAYFSIPAGALGIGDTRLIMPLIPLFVIVSGVGAERIRERFLDRQQTWGMFRS
jgi:4-amino-4-deoxy-L-arabinose transferase-like glycosyltransferase